MAPEITQTDDSVEVKAETSVAEIKKEEELAMVKIPPTEPATNEQWQQFSKRISAFFDELPGYVSDFFNAYKPFLVTLGWILLALASVKVTLAVLDAINDIPLLEVTLELIGIAYVIWFVFRYLLSAASRQELSKDIQSFKEQYLGTQN